MLVEAAAMSNPLEVIMLALKNSGGERLAVRLKITCACNTREAKSVLTGWADGLQACSCAIKHKQQTNDTIGRMESAPTD